MSTGAPAGSPPGWARALATRAPAALVAAAVEAAVTGRGDPDHQRLAIAPLLEGRGEVTAARVLAGLAARLQLGAGTQDAGRAGAALRRAGAEVLLAGSPGYPAALARAWPDLGAPVWLFARWAEPLPDRPAVAVVGTRQPTADGLRTARELGWVLATRGVTVVSGMARGIDQAAHRGALDAGGRTVAVLGTGLDVDYPRGDGDLRDEVAAAGGLLTELAPGSPPLPRHFLWRNRVISGLADMTVVVEGRGRSGSLQTARLAAAQGRDVWAVPGSLHAPASQGPLALLRDGAQVVTRLEDVLDAALATLPPTQDPAGSSPGRRPAHGRNGGAVAGPALPLDLSDDAAALLPLLGAVPASPGSLVGPSGLPLPRLLAAVAELTGRGAATATPRGICRA